jgi:hypothetical protein
MIPRPITSWRNNLLRYKTKPKVMDVVVVDKMNPMREETDGPPRAMLGSILLSILHV